MGNRPVCLRVEIPTLLRLKELRANRQSLFVPFQASEDIRTPGGLVEPATGSQIGPLLYEIEPIPTGRNTPVSLDRLRSRIPTNVPIDARRLQRQIANGITDRHSPGRGGRKARSAALHRHYECPLSLLGDTVFNRV